MSTHNISTEEHCCPCTRQNEQHSEGRRKILSGMGWGAFIATLGISTGAGLRYMFPRVLFEPPSTFRIGTLEDYPAGEPDTHGVVSVSEKYMESHRVWIVREIDKLYAIFGKCTHLGCTPKWYPDERQYKCPCHGSKYYSNGVNFAGPAPRPMDRYGIRTLEDGRIEVDMSILYTEPHFAAADCFVTI